MSFEALLNDLEALQKARPPQFEPDADQQGGPSDGDADNAPPKKKPAKKDPDDKKIAAAADSDQDGDGKTDGDDDLAEMDDKDDDEDEIFGKSFAVTTESGETIEAYDGTALMKAFEQRLAALEEAHEAREQHIEQAEAVIHKQAELIKSMHGDLAKLKEQGRGRKSALTVHDKPASVPAAPVKPAPATVLAKAMSAQQAGKMTGSDVACIESYLSRGLALPADLADLVS